MGKPTKLVDQFPYIGSFIRMMKSSLLNSFNALLFDHQEFLEEFKDDMQESDLNLALFKEFLERERDWSEIIEENAFTTCQESLIIGSLRSSIAGLNIMAQEYEKIDLIEKILIDLYGNNNSNLTSREAAIKIWSGTPD